ncbi:dihydroorotate oxidase A [Lacibacter cauensis]|uniref:Dihydroorotate dehydrogenase (quinone) n=2 Tax=Lacibacter cauensis TaxID=510947 RepID=A0A562SQW9_9BACT|nr:dihydroorotate oxidase A [Lacibacter cauensis]
MKFIFARMYQLIRSIFFWFDAEKVHYFAMNALRFFCSIGFIKKILAANFQAKNKKLAFESWGLEFKNRVGLAAGFDKNAKYLRELEVLGFGFVEIGTVTPKPQDGNDQPRLFRLPKDKAIINRMGFNNDGVKVVAERLKKWKEKHEVQSTKYENSPLTTHHSRLIIGGNIGKNKVTPNEDAWKDYEICFNELFDYVDYFVVNVSSPNTPGLRELQEKDSLRKILSHLQTLRTERLKLKIDSVVEKPILLKIAPDLTQSQLDDVIDLAKEIQLDGLVASNTTISREGLITDAAIVTAIGAGGLSGLPVKQRSTEIVQYITQKTNGEIPVIASGGIFSAADANEKLQAGAVLVQVWTGFIYEGPAIAKKICNGIAVQ